jgi:hypothetical protein
MARPSAECIQTAQAAQDMEVDILQSTGYWCLAYKGQPVQIRQRNYQSGVLVMKYPRTGFNNKAHCVNMAFKMNMLFDTQDFSCLTLLDPWE